MVMFNRDKNLRAIERFMYKYSVRPTTTACDIADIVGVVADIKPAAFNSLQADLIGENELWRFTKLLERLGLRVIFERRSFGGALDIYYFVAKSHKRAAKLQDAFHELWNKGKSKEIDMEIGALLGYPETAVRYYSSFTDSLSEAHSERAKRNRFYAHSATHEDDEFLAYEVPIYRQLQRHCPKTAKILRAQTEKRWLD